MTTLNDLAVSVYLLAGGDRFHHPTTLERAGQIDGPDKWAIRHLGACLNRDGAWEYEPLPSSRDAAFLARCRFESPEVALALWDRYRGVST